MTAATYRRISPRGSAPRWTWATVVALLAALAVLIHHDSVGAVTPTTAMSAMPGTDHTASVRTTARTGHHEAARTAAPAMDHDGGGACSGPAMQHCSSGDVGTPRLLAPPSALAHTVHGSATPGFPHGRSPSGVAYRAPPDLSVLSRLLI
ncbi:hypothetical protein [Streptomyces monashensis]|uniref:Uncharacterized protein n=1 Tax=Streptomyces monashensis TaxID=1678012 RepID=A0A1S2QKI5_9ACTN|nr:hypothetical protein [Streptomyces monashensis]OIK06137.1 hypothetical protein BIV23_09095 [Streptomyces monashensis]